MMYDVIVLGATFAAAGIGQKKKECCLILDSKPYAGYEFLNAMHFGTGYEKELKSQEALTLREAFADKQVWTEERVCLFDCAPLLYRSLQQIPVLFNTQIISVEKTENGYRCLTHSISGYQSFEAKRVVDTRSIPDMCTSKTYNLLMDGVGKPDLPDWIQYAPWGLSHNYVLRLQIPMDAGYADARKKAMQFLEDLPKEHKLLLLPDEFDYTVGQKHFQTQDGVIYLPSKAYENPLLAFDAGVCLELGGECK